MFLEGFGLSKDDLFIWEPVNRFVFKVLYGNIPNVCCGHTFKFADQWCIKLVHEVLVRLNTQGGNRPSLSHITTMVTDA